jgi:hypothetical protein
MGRGRRRRSRSLRRVVLRALEPLSLARSALVLAALAVIAASLVGPPSGAMIVRPDLPLDDAQVFEEPADEFEAWAAIPNLTVSPRFELAIAHEPVKRRLVPEEAPVAVEPPVVAKLPSVPPSQPHVPLARAPAERPHDRTLAIAPAAPSPPAVPEPTKPTATLSTKLAMMPVLPRKELPRPSGRARLAIVIDDLGPAVSLTHKAIGLPRPVTLAFLPYAQELPALTAAAKARGHEVYLHLPMEPVGTPDPGPNAILVGLEPDEFRRRLSWAFDRLPLATGVNNHMGSRATSEPETMLKVLQEVRRRGLSFVDSRTSPLSVADGLAAQLAIPHAARDVFLDNNPSPQAILVQLTLAERLARRQGHALAIGHPYPSTLAVLARWLPEAEARGVQIVTAGQLIAALACRSQEPLQVNACVGPDCPPPPDC